MELPRSRGAVSGSLLIILGIWVAIVPFVGPLFDYTIGPTSAWEWTLGRLWLNVLPGAVAILAGLVVTGAARQVSIGTAGWAAAIAGGWIVVGPQVSRVWNDGFVQSGAAGGDTNMQVLEVLGYSLLVGSVIAALGAFALGRASIGGADEVRRASEAPRPASPPPTRVTPTSPTTPAHHF